MREEGWAGGFIIIFGAADGEVKGEAGVEANGEAGGGADGEADVVRHVENRMCEAAVVRHVEHGI